MEVSKSDIDFEFDSTDSEGGGDDVSIATDASSVEGRPLPSRGVRAVTKQLDQSLEIDDEGDDFLRGIGGDDSDSNSDLSVGSEELMSPRANGESKRSSVNSEDFGPPIVVPLKTGSDHSESPNSPKPGNFQRRAPVRTKSGGMSASTHSAASGRRRPPPRTKSGRALRKRTMM